jgi:hypothetical protein
MCAPSSRSAIAGGFGVDLHFAGEGSMSDGSHLAVPRVRVAAARPAPLVLAAGLASTVVSLGGVWALSRYTDQNVMGWYADYVLPVGPILVGLVASCGFGIASWKTGAKITGPLLLGVAAILVGGYWAAQVIEFRLLFPAGAVKPDGTEAGFLDFYDAVTRSFTWVEHGKQGAQLGAWGYALRAGEIVGFSGGGLAVPVILRKLPYCQACGVYMRSPVVALLPAGVQPKRISKKKTEELAAHEAQANAAFARAQEGLTRLLDAAEKGDAQAFAAAVADEGPLARRRAAGKLSARIQVKLVHCARCGAGELRASVVTGQGKHIKVTPIATRPLERGIAPRLLART